VIGYKTLFLLFPYLGYKYFYLLLFPHFGHFYLFLFEKF
jgi:hypothetical protein